MDASEKRIVIPISGPRGSEPSEPPDTPRSAGSRAPGEKRPSTAGAGRPQPPKPAVGGAAEAVKKAEPAKEAAPEVPDDVNGADEFDDLLTSLRAALEEGEEAVAAGESGEPSQARPSDEEAPSAEDISDAFTFPDWLEGIDAGAVEMPGTPEGRGPSPAPETPAESNQQRSNDAPPRRRYVYRSHESSRVGSHQLACRVTLAFSGREYSGLAEGASIPGLRAEIAARATLNAVANAEGGAVVLSLSAARVLRFVDMPLVVVSIYGMHGDEVKRLVGAAPVDNSEEQASVLATLQATDRWLTATALGY